MLIYSEKSSPRLDYILRFIFKKLIGSDFDFTTNIVEFENFEGPKISYSKTSSQNGIWITASDFLFETNIHETELKISETSWGKIIFSETENKTIPFDFFSASFYLISRYEEYLPFKPDSLGRFPFQESVLFKEGLISEPVVNLWIEKLKEIIINRFPEFTSKRPSFNFISTIDIDNAFAYMGKSFIRNAGGFSKEIISGKINSAKTRIKVLRGKKTDPYDSYDYLVRVHEKYKTKPKVFVLNGQYGKYDKNLSPENPNFKQKLELIGKISEFGIHPSFSSNFNNGIKEEKNNLERSVNQKIQISRQHFLMLSFPKTYLTLIEYGIKNDYSMGYSQILGYRAGTCTPFSFFDLTNNSETDLIIYPFSWMDRTLKQFLKYSPDEAINKISKDIELVKKLGGTYISLWHNESLGDSDFWKGWKDVFEFTLKKVTE